MFASVAGLIVLFLLFYEVVAQLYQEGLTEKISYAEPFAETVCVELDLLSNLPSVDWISDTQECYRALAYHACDKTVCDRIDWEYSRSWCYQDVLQRQRRGECRR